jgi:hypothetical protein
MVSAVLNKSCKIDVAIKGSANFKIWGNIAPDVKSRTLLLLFVAVTMSSSLASAKSDDLVFPYHTLFPRLCQ